jgi:hypothetical protein
MERREKVELFEQIRRVHEFGVGTVLGVARRLGVHRRMVRQALANAQPSERPASVATTNRRSYASSASAGSLSSRAPPACLRLLRCVGSSVYEDSCEPIADHRWRATHDVGAGPSLAITDRRDLLTPLTIRLTLISALLCGP